MLAALSIPACLLALPSMDIEDLKPCVPTYGPCTVRNLRPGDVVLWCQCGLSKKNNGLWCDGSHAGTGFKPLRWVVPGTKAEDGEATTTTRFSVCNCKYTASKPLCDGTHSDLPLTYHKQIAECSTDHATVTKLCSKCGYTPAVKEVHEEVMRTLGDVSIWKI